MSTTLENAIFFMVKTYLDSRIVTPMEAIQVLENVQVRIGRDWKRDR